MKLEVAVKDISPTRRELTVEIPVEEVNTAYDKALDEYTRYARIPGFRQGRAPRSVVRQRFSKELKDEVVSKLLPHALSHAVTDNKLQPIGDPDLQFDRSAFRQGEPLRFGVQLEVIPDFELRPYRGIKLTRRVVTVSEEDVDRIIDSFRQSAAEFVTVDDRPAELGDFVSVDLHGKYVLPADDSAVNSTDAADPSPEQSAEQLEDLKAEDLQVEIGGEGVHPEFTSNLTGVKADDVRQFRVAYAPDFTSKGLAGKTLDFTAKVIAVRRKELPELTDENIGQFGRFESVDHLRRETREMLQTRYSQRTDAWLKEDLLDAIGADYDFEMPQRFFQNQYNQRAQQFIQGLFSSGLTPDQIARVNVRRELKQLNKTITREIRSSLILQRIGVAESVKVTREDVEAEVLRRAAAEGVPVAEMYDRLTKDDAVSSIESGLFYDNTLKHLLGLSEITDTEITTDEAAARDSEASQPDDDSDDGDEPAGEDAEASSTSDDSPSPATGLQSAPATDQTGSSE